MKTISGIWILKLPGQKKGINGPIQMDTKIKGLSDEIINKTLEGAQKARLFILEKMKDANPGSFRNINRCTPL